jgi:hypothetical protein
MLATAMIPAALWLHIGCTVIDFEPGMCSDLHQSWCAILGLNQ